MLLHMHISSGPLTPDEWVYIVDGLTPAPETIHITGPGVDEYPDLGLLLKVLDRDGRRIVLSAGLRLAGIAKESIIKHCDMVYLDLSGTDRDRAHDLLHELRDAGVGCRIRFVIDPYNLDEMIAVYTLGYPVIFVHGEPGNDYDLELLYRCMAMCKTAVFLPNLQSRQELKKHYSRSNSSSTVSYNSDEMCMDHTGKPLRTAQYGYGL